MAYINALHSTHIYILTYSANVLIVDDSLLMGFKMGISYVSCHM